METLMAAGIGLLVACGGYLLLRPRTFDSVLGITLLSYAVNLFIFSPGRLVIGRAPVVLDGTQGLADPLPQALVLTAIVITFAVSSFLLALIYRSWRLANADDVSDDADDVALRGGAVLIEAEETAPEASTTDFPHETEPQR